MTLNENFKIVPLLKPSDYGTGGKPSAGLNIKNAHWVTFILVGATVADGDNQIKLTYGTTQAADAGDVPAVMGKMLGTGAAIEAVGADALSVEVDYESDQVYWLLPDDNDRMYVVEVDPSKIPAGNDWIALDCSAAGGAATYSLIAIVQPRYKPAGTMVRTA